VDWIDRALTANEQAWGTPENGSNALYRHHLATIYARFGECKRAAALFREALAMRRRLLGPDHPVTRTTFEALAKTLDNPENIEITTDAELPEPVNAPAADAPPN
jgi:hypothetical protein